VSEHTPAAADTGEDDDFTYEPAPLAEAEQVSSPIAIIRIVAVLAMGVSVSLGLFFMLIGGSALVVGSILILLAIPVYFAMQYAEKLAGSRRDSAP
jgi:hypothetical protein